MIFGIFINFFFYQLNLAYIGIGGKRDNLTCRAFGEKLSWRMISFAVILKYANHSESS